MRRAAKWCGSDGGDQGAAYNHSVGPSEYGKLIEAGNQVPSSGDVASYEDAKSQDGEGVHRIARLLRAGPAFPGQTPPLDAGVGWVWC